MPHSKQIITCPSSLRFSMAHSSFQSKAVADIVMSQLSVLVLGRGFCHAGKASAAGKEAAATPAIPRVTNCGKGQMIEKEHRQLVAITRLPPLFERFPKMH
mmetsp:Transcript_78203/g.123132  ORF Transcript_78203/g.123132 Transcript_78203/m.123132 type:complete len:101 (+) Transcript_78203:1327-1629(+)